MNRLIEFEFACEKEWGRRWISRIKAGVWKYSDRFRYDRKGQEDPGTELDYIEAFDDNGQPVQFKNNEDYPADIEDMVWHEYAKMEEPVV